MSRAGSSHWSPERDLETLLDGLTDTLLGTSDCDIAILTREIGLRADTIARHVRRVIAAAEAGPIVTPAADFTAPGLRAYIARNQ